MSDQTSDMARRVADLEAELARTRAERDRYKRDVHALLEQVMPSDPPTPEEIHDMRYGPRGPSLLEIAAEFERQLADDPAQS